MFPHARSCSKNRLGRGFSFKRTNAQYHLLFIKDTDALGLEITIGYHIYNASNYCHIHIFSNDRDRS